MTEYGRNVDDALSKDRLDELKPDSEEMFRNTYRATVWYNEAVWTAASIFVQAARESDEFRKDFVSEEQIQVDAFPNEDGESLVESDKWRETMKEEVPGLHGRLMSIGLSAFQGGNAEKTARNYIERNL